MKILIVENEEYIVDILVEAVEDRFLEQYSDLTIENHSFEDTFTLLDDFNPDAVILDIYETRMVSDAHTSGIKIADKILGSDNAFLIIFSGFPESIPNIDELERNSSISVVKKGAGSENKVADILYDIYCDV